MQVQTFAQEILNFNKNAVKMGFEVLSTISSQAVKTADQILGATPNVPEEGKKVVDLLFKENQKVLSSQRKFVESGLEIDWTSKNAPVKGLEAMESFYNSAFSQAGALQDETKELLKKATEQLPKEAKPMVDFWNDALNSNLQIFQNFVTKNFELAKKVMSDLAAEVPKAETPKAETQKAEAQKAEAQKAEAQKAEAQKVEAQKVEAQKAEAQKAEAQKAEAQKAEVQKAEAPKAEAPKAEAKSATK